MHTLEDDSFDLIFPPEIRALSRQHWTPVSVARRAAEFLVTAPGTRVLDVGCGPGKFCIVGALTTPGQFTGVEQRESLGDLAREVIKKANIGNAEIIRANVMEIDFSRYDAFYLFNPFEENLFSTGKIDASVKLSKELYQQYTEHVAEQFARAPLGTRVVTYWGLCEEVPLGYECQESSLHDTLRLWQKTVDYPVRKTPRDADSMIGNGCFSFDSELLRKYPGAIGHES